MAQFARCTSSAPHGGSVSRKSTAQHAAGSPPENPHRHTQTMGASLWATTGRTDLVQRLQPLFAGAPAICACEGNLC